MELEIPKGKELELKEADEWKELPERSLRFVPKILGSILYNDKRSPLKPTPFVFAIRVSGATTRLRKVCPWFVTCPGGCLEEVLKGGEPHSIHLFQVLTLPEIDIPTLMICSGR
jgi:hypothetical protein